MIKKLVILIIFTLFSFQALAQEEGTHIAYGDLSFTLDPSLPQNLLVRHFPADPLDMAYPGGPQPAHLEMSFFDGNTAPEFAWDANVNVFLYHTGGMFSYESHFAEFQALQTLLANRPALSNTVGTGIAVLPWLPVANAAQVLVAKAQYLDLCGLSGVSYLAYYSQAVNVITERDIFYTFQGLSADGETYIAMSFRPTASVFPSEAPADMDYDAFATDYQTYLETSLASLVAAPPESFNPSLTALDSVFRSLSLGAAIATCF
jgi:hypothetical protein